MRGVGRPERKLDPSKPLHAFAAQLRELREQAGSPKYLTMARDTEVSQGALQNAAGGDHFPTWRTVEAYVRACGGDPDDWRQRWERLRDQVKSAGDATNGNGHGNGGAEVLDTADSVASKHLRWLWPVITLLLVVVTAVTVHMADRVMLPTQASTPPKPAALAVIVIQNKVARGADELVEDSPPVYLSSRPEPYCRLNGCKIPGYDWNSGVALVANCHVAGTMMYNYDLDSAPVQSNPNKAKSNLWYHVVLPDKTNGFVSEVYIAPAYRGGLGLPVCKAGTSA